MDVLTAGPAGLDCAAGGFTLDPWQPVPRAVVTHAHGDHLLPGCGEYWCAEPGSSIVRRRAGPGAVVHAVPYGRPFPLGGAELAFHPAGHVLGSAQVRVSAGAATWVVSGDYKRAADPTCEPFVPVPCDVFVTEATFGLPIYRWPPAEEVARQILEWWDLCRAQGQAAVLFCYVLGKAQRILAELARLTDRRVLVHGMVEAVTALYREEGVHLLPTESVVETRLQADGSSSPRRTAQGIPRGRSFAGELVLAPPSAGGTPWMRRLGDRQTALASGWMRVRGTRRRKAVDRGFVLSDHADWPALLQTVKESGARRVLVTHGSTQELARYLQEQGTDAAPLATAWAGEQGAEA
jgi:putative mRNA 3-end processing factor